MGKLGKILYHIEQDKKDLIIEIAAHLIMICLALSSVFIYSLIRHYPIEFSLIYAILIILIIYTPIILSLARREYIIHENGILISKKFLSLIRKKGFVVLLKNNIEKMSLENYPKKFITIYITLLTGKKYKIPIRMENLLGGFQETIEKFYRENILA